MSKKLVCLLTALLILASGLFTVSASSSQSYTYTSELEVSRVPDPYEAVGMYGPEWGLSEPKDMAVGGGYVYVLDSGNNRISVLSASDYRFIRYITFQQGGQPYDTFELTGLCLDGNTLLVVDHGSEKIFRINTNGEVLKEYVSPYEEGSEEVFMPKAVAVDRTGYLYILLDTEYRGLMVMDPDGNYCNYFGSVNVTVTATVLSNMFWRRFMTEEQIQTSSQYVPGGYANVASDENGFIYTVRGASETKKELISKLNPSGKNVLRYTGEFGDFKTKTETSFVSVAVNGDGMLAALDGANNHVFFYSQDGELLFVFGAKSQQDGVDSLPQYGTFVTPSAVAFNGTELLVLDRDANALTVFRPTKFGSLVQEATTLHRKAAFEEAGKIWSQVLTLNSNYGKAYIGLGKVAEAAGNYKEAMENYKIGGNREYYSSAFKKYRADVLRQSFYGIVAGLVVLIVGVVLLRKYRKKHPKKKLAIEDGGKLRYMFHTVVHPFDGFSELRYNKKYSVKYATILALLWFFVSCLNYNYNGYIFNSDSASDFNMWIVLLSTVVLVLLYTLSTWLLSTFLEGKGRFSEIWVVSCYSLIPLIGVSILSLVLSNVMSADESFFYYAIHTIGTGWTLVLLFISNQELNQYSFKKNIFGLLCTVVGMLVIVFLIFLFFNLWTQLLSFLGSLYDEITYRRLAAG